MGRTSKIFSYRTHEKPSKIKGFQLWSFHEAILISSQPRYDRFDTSANAKFIIQYHQQNCNQFIGKRG